MDANDRLRYPVHTLQPTAARRDRASLGWLDEARSGHSVTVNCSRSLRVDILSGTHASPWRGSSSEIATPIRIQRSGKISLTPGVPFQHS